jgi:hypothetical protein
MLRPLRILRSVRVLRLLRLARLAAFAVEGIHEARGILRRRGLSWVLLIVAALILVAAALMLNFERGVPNGNIGSYSGCAVVGGNHDHHRRLRRPVPSLPGWPWGRGRSDGVAHPTMFSSHTAE